MKYSIILVFPSDNLPLNHTSEKAMRRTAKMIWKSLNRGKSAFRAYGTEGNLLINLKNLLYAYMPVENN